MNQRIGYARVSTDDQNLDLQRNALHLAGVELIYEKTASGKAVGRLELDLCLGKMRKGDTLVVWRLDRLGRSLPDLVHIIAALEEKGIGFESVTEQIATIGSTGKQVAQVFAALADFERNLSRERTRARLAAARARGRSGGRKPKLDTRQIREIKRLISDPTIPVSQIAERYKVSRTTIYKVALRSVASVEEPLSDASGAKAQRQYPHERRRNRTGHFRTGLSALRCGGIPLRLPRCFWQQRHHAQAAGRRENNALE